MGTIMIEQITGAMLDHDLIEGTHDRMIDEIEEP